MLSNKLITKDSDYTDAQVGAFVVINPGSKTGFLASRPNNFKIQASLSEVQNQTSDQRGTNSPEALWCVLVLCLVLVQHWKTRNRPAVTEKLLTVP